MSNETDGVSTSKQGGDTGAAFESQGEDGGVEVETPWYWRWNTLEKLILPGLLLLVVVLIVSLFEKVLLPFVFAFAIVYLMEPIVKRFSRTPTDPRGLPRWLTVVLVYLVFFGVVTVSGLLIVPRFVGEVVRLGDTVPRGIRTFRQDELPGLNERLQTYLQAFIPGEKLRDGIRRSRETVAEARQRAAGAANGLELARARLHRARALESVWGPDRVGSDSERLRPRGRRPSPPERPHGTWGIEGEPREPALRFVRGERGFEVYLGAEAVEVQRRGDDRWTLRRARLEGGPATGEGELTTALDLETRLNRLIESAITFSSEQLASLIEFAHSLIVGILEAFIAIILTLMVAAFISIDLPRLMSFVRSLVPEHLTPGYDQLLGRLDEGLAGVVRGQLIICLINGIFTYVGLALLNVKFSVLLAVVAGIFSIIPVFGTVISTIPICLIALTQSFTKGVLVLGWILFIHFVEANILNPKIIGTSAEIHPAIVIFALLAGESSYGLVGAILGVPVASIVLTLFKFVRDKVREADAEPEAATGD
jgi:predicted PurR-regulated permease PerM